MGLRLDPRTTLHRLRVTPQYVSSTNNNVLVLIQGESS